MKKIIRYSAAFCMMALMFSACGLTQDAGSVPDKMVGSNPGELEKRIEALLKKAGTDLEKAEFAEIATSCNRKGASPSFLLMIDLVSPENPNKLVRATWFDSERNRNDYSVEGLMLTDSDNNVVEDHAAFADMLFSYADVKTYIGNAPVYCTESLEASGYQENGFVERLDIQRLSYEGYRLSARMRVGYKGQITMHKTYDVASDGLHIVKK